MTTQEQYIERLKEMVAAKFGHAILSADDCATLAEVVSEATGDNIDRRSLEFMFLAKRLSITPRPVTLSTLARYVGYSSWSELCTSREVLPAADADIIPATRRWGVIILTTAAIILVASATLYLLLGGIYDNGKDRLAELCSPIEERWRAIATEECNGIRAYSAEEDYNSRIEELIATAEATMHSEVESEIAARAKTLGITLDNTTIEEQAADIVSSCLNIYNCLRLE